jgi:hypothetical protein
MASSEMLRRVALVRTDVSKELSAHFIRVTRTGELGTTLALTVTVVNLSFLARSRYFSFKYLLIYAHDAEWTPFQIHSYSENLVGPGIEPGTSGLAARNSDH